MNPWCPASGTRVTAIARRVACPMCDRRIPQVNGRLVSHRAPAVNPYRAWLHALEHMDRPKSLWDIEDEAVS